MTQFPVEHKTLTRSLSRPSLFNPRALIALLFGSALLWSLLQAGVFGRELINEGGWPLAWRFISASVRPDLSTDLLRVTWQAMLQTLAFAVCGTLLSVVLGIVGGVLSTEIWWQSVRGQRSQRWRWLLPFALPWLSVRGVLAVPRAIHEVIWGLFFVNILGLDPLVAVLAIAIPFGAITAKVFAEIIDETPQDAFHALHSTGTPPFKALMYSLLPQAFPDLLSYAFYRLECAIRAAAVMGLIGAGGLGFQILLSLQSLQYGQMWTFLYALIMLTGATDLWSSFLRRRLKLVSRIDINAGQLNRPNKWSYHSDPVARYSLLLSVLLIPLSFWYVQADLSRLVAPRTFRLLADVVRDSFPPRLEPELLTELWRLSAQTLSMSILAMTFAGFGGLLLALPAANNFVLPGGIFDAGARPWQQVLGGACVLLITRGLLLVTRAISEPIWALIALLILFPGILPGAIGLGIYNLGILGRLMAEVTENVDNQPLRALKAQGASGLQTFLYGVLPTTLPRCLAYILYRWEVCIRATVIVGLVGAGGLGRLLTEQLSSFDYRGVVTTLLFFIGLTFIVDLISTLVRRTIR